MPKSEVQFLQGQFSARSRTSNLEAGHATGATSLYYLCYSSDGSRTRGSATTVDDVVSALQSDPVYNDPKAENALTDAQASRPLRPDPQQRVRHVHRDPARSREGQSQSTEDVVTYLQQNVGEPGTYAAVVGNQFRST
jgi:hypothetical protein